MPSTPVHFRPLTLLFLLLTACASEEVSAPDDTVAPRVLSTLPAANAVRVLVGTAIQATFSEPMDASTVDATSFSVTGLAGTVDLEGTVATFTPINPMVMGTEYTATISTAVTDRAGNPLAEEFRWSFTPNAASLADAGPDVALSIGDPITLDGSNSGTIERPGPFAYAWTQTLGPSVVLDPTLAQPVLTGLPDRVSTLEFELVVTDASGASSPDRVSVWILEDKDHAVFVSATGNDINPGTRSAPLASLQVAIDAMAAAGEGGDVYVAAGTYEESILLTDGVSIHGGFAASSWLRDGSISTIQGTVTPERSRTEVAVFGAGITDVTLGDLQILGAPGSNPGHSSVGIWLAGSTGIRVDRCDVVAGPGRAGADAGSHPRREQPGPADRGKASGTCGSSNCCGSVVADCRLGASGQGNGGNGGASRSARVGCAGRDGGDNPDADCGGPGSFAPCGLGGIGADADSDAGDGIRGYSRADQVADPGAGGASFGSTDSGADGAYVPAEGEPGAEGRRGGGGGGGGGGNDLAGCGPTGGGGGQGGPGGHGGFAGGGGGASIGILVTVGSSVDILESTVSTGVGGRGGMGGVGGEGGPGGPGGLGRPNDIGRGDSGRGGNGGAGGWGGPGGGGGGGPSLGILVDPTSTATLESVVPGSAGIAPGGEGGTGGAQPNGPTAGNGAQGRSGLFVQEGSKRG